MARHLCNAIYGRFLTLMMKTAHKRHQWGQPVDIVAEPIDPEFKACILTRVVASVNFT